MRSGSRWEGGGERNGWAGLLWHEWARATGEAKGQSSSGCRVLAGLQGSLLTRRTSGSHMLAFPCFHSSYSLRARPGLSPRSPGRIQRISLLSPQNVGTVTLSPFVFSGRWTRPQAACTGTCAIRAAGFDVMEWHPLGTCPHHLWKN